MQLNRRDVLKLGLASIPVALLSSRSSLWAQSATAGAKVRPNSTIDGVRVGIIAPYSTSGASSAAGILQFLIDAGISHVELQADPVESFAGSPGASGIPALTIDQDAAITAMNASVIAQTTAANQARTALAQASLTAPGTIREKLDALTQAELNLATARADALARLQGGAQKLSSDQIRALAASSATAGGRGGGGFPGGGPGGPGGPGGRGGGANPDSPVAKWRSSVALDRFAALRKMYNDAGVSIYAFKADSGFDGLTDGEVDYFFKVAKALGASHITMEISNNEGTLKRNAEFAGRHQLHVAYHNHGAPDNYDAVLAAGPYSSINMDVGHFTAAYGKSPIPVIEKYHARIKSMHFKDRTYTAPGAGGGPGGGNLPWGQGDTPLTEVLRLMRSQKYDFPATIEKEYATPAGSTTLAEIQKCVAYCRKALA